ncbi:MAG: hypothetical protein HZA37_01410 [Parcubacteria group bacterium]|nr:hypothetical protein [Parcubacteria group bacterium]
MTILQPRKGLLKENIRIILLAAVLILTGATYVFEYNRIVNLRHETERQSLFLRNGELLNVELKNDYYRLVDATALETVAWESGLTLDGNPRYLNANQSWASAL